MALTFALIVPVQTVQAEKIDTMVFEGDFQQENDMLSVQPRTTLFNNVITMAFSVDGLLMDFSTACYGEASVIGVKDIKVQQKVWYGWKTVYTSDGAENLNENVFAYTLLYPDAVKDRTYRVTCTHYANVDVYEEVPNDTGSFKFTY